MNILAEAQKRMLETENPEARARLEAEFNELYFKTREKDENSFLGKLSLKTRCSLHWLVILVFKIKNALSGFKCEVLYDKRENTDRPIIFAITHIGKLDIEVSFIPLKEHFYVLTGDYEHLQGLVDGAFITLNGVFFFNERVKEDRKAVAEKMTEHLKQGGNIMYFPEGAWNLKPALPMLPCYWGIVDISQKSNAIVIPVAIEQYGKRFKMCIGKNFDMQNYGSDNGGKSKAITDLRDVMATLKYDIWESEPQLKRSELVGDEWDNYIKDRLAEWPYFSVKYIDDLTYHPKNITTQDEAFAHLNHIQPTQQTAFLFNKRLK